MNANSYFNTSEGLLIFFCSSFVFFSSSLKDDINLYVNTYCLANQTFPYSTQAQEAFNISILTLSEKTAVVCLCNALLCSEVNEEIRIRNLSDVWYFNVKHTLQVIICRILGTKQRYVFLPDLLSMHFIFSHDRCYIHIPWTTREQYDCN